MNIWMLYVLSVPSQKSINHNARYNVYEMFDISDSDKVQSVPNLKETLSELALKH